MSKLAGKVFRIGHLGSFNDLMLMGTLCGAEMGLSLACVPHNKGGAQAAMDYLAAPSAAAGFQVPALKVAITGANEIAGKSNVSERGSAQGRGLKSAPPQRL